MPLPTNTALTLSVARTNDTTSSGLKHAMFVRMSAETLDALEAFPGQPTLDFDFGDRSGIYIGESFFPMRHTAQDGPPHELYLRTSQNNKKTPLKLHANIIGKISIERELQDDLREKIRGTSNDAQAQKASRTTILLDNADVPPLQQPRRKLPPNMFHKPIANTPKPSTSTASTNPKKEIPASSVDIRPKIRKQLVHYLAAGDKTDDQLTALFEKESPNTKREMRLILGQISESTAVGQSGSRYTLKHPIWKEVRPHEYPLPDDERNAMIRTARKVFHILGIPESDPIWNHVRQRSPPASNPAASASHSVQEDKPKVTKPDASQRTNMAPARAKPSTTRPPATKDDSSRNLPPKPVPTSDSRQPTSHDSRRAPTDSTVDRSGMHSKSSSISKSKPSAPIYPSKSSASTSSKASTSRIEEQSPPPRKSKVSGRDSPAYFEERDRPRASNSDKKMREATPDRYPKEAKPLAKRKIPLAESEHGGDRHASPDPKRRKVDDTAPSRRDPPRKPDAPSQAQSSYRDKDDASSRNVDRGGSSQKVPKRLKEPSRSDSPMANDSSSSKVSKGKASSIKSRQAPVFTSSDEDEEDSRPLKRAAKREPTPPSKRPVKRERERVPSPLPSKRIKRESSASPRPDDHLPQPPPLPTNNSDHAALRTRYENSYEEYIECFQKLVAEKRKLNRLLKNEDARSIGSVDSDMDLMDPEELSRLTNTHRKLHRELENIHNVFAGKA